MPRRQEQAIGPQTKGRPRVEPLDDLLDEEDPHLERPKDDGEAAHARRAHRSVAAMHRPAMEVGIGNRAADVTGEYSIAAEP